MFSRFHLEVIDFQSLGYVGFVDYNLLRSGLGTLLFVNTQCCVVFGCLVGCALSSSWPRLFCDLVTFVLCRYLARVQFSCCSTSRVGVYFLTTVYFCSVVVTLHGVSVLEQRLFVARLRRRLFRLIVCLFVLSLANPGGISYTFLHSRMHATVCPSHFLGHSLIIIYFLLRCRRHPWCSLFRKAV